MSIWQRIKDAAAFLIVGLVGVAVALLVSFFKIVPDRDRKRREEAKKKADSIKAELEKQHAARAAKVAQQIAVVKEEEKARLEADPVDEANKMILEAMKEQK